MRSTPSIPASMFAAFGLLALICPGQTARPTRGISGQIAQVQVSTGQAVSAIEGVAGAAENTGAAASQVPGAASRPSCRAETLSVEVGRFFATVRAT